MRFTYILFAISIVAFATNSYAQMPNMPAGMNQANAPKIGKINGFVFDEATGLPLDYATVTLLKTGDSTIVSGTITDEKGKFEITEVPFGAYIVKADFIGYQSVYIAPVLIQPNLIIKDLGKVNLKPASSMLTEVVVTTEREQMINSIDKQVFNVEKNIVTQGGSATDVLQQVPSVTIDMDGNVSLRGSGNVTVLIDGRPSGLSGDRSTVLSQIPANSIESIEVITNPSAKYDPDGMGGIINIVLKKNRKNGFNGNIGVTIGTRNKYNGTLALNYRNKKVNIYTNYNYRYNIFHNEFTSFRKNIFSDTAFGFDQKNNSETKSSNHLIKSGIDIYVNDLNTLSISGTIGQTTTKQPGINYYTFTDKDDVGTSFSTREFQENEHQWNGDAAIDYRKTYKEMGRLLTASLSFSHAPYARDAFYTDKEYMNKSFDVSLPPYDYEQQFRNQKVQIGIAQLDYTHPLKKGKVETGYKSSIRYINTEQVINDYDSLSQTFIKNNLNSNHFTYLEQVHAVYGQYAMSVKKFGFQVGLRLEQALTKGTFVDSAKTYKNNYFSPFPSVNISYKMEKNQELSIGYSRRINRPGVGQLNPGGDFGDPLNIRIGNPYLDPEYINAVNSGYKKDWEKAGITLSAFVMQRQNGFMRVRTVDSASASSYVTFVNLAKSINYGLDINTKLSPVKWWNMNLGGTIYQSRVNYTTAERVYENNNVSWTIKMNTTFTVWENMNIQLSYNVQGPIVIPQGDIKVMHGMDFAIKKDFLKEKNLTVNLRVSDVFNTRQFSINLNDVDFIQRFTFKRESLVGYIGVTYRFGKEDKSAQKFQKRQNIEQQPDMNMF